MKNGRRRTGRDVSFLLLLLSCLWVAACGNPCETLVEESCRVHGDDSVVCLTRSRELDEPSSRREQVCRRALMVHRSLEAVEGTQ